MWGLVGSGCVPVPAVGVDGGVDAPVASDVPTPDARDARDAPLPIGPARLLWPPSGAALATRQPRLRWTDPPNAAAVRVELCSTADCATVLQTVETDVDEVLLPRPLSAHRVYFWRVSSLDAAGRVAATSPAWVLGAGSRSEPSDALVGLLAGYVVDGEWVGGPGLARFETSSTPADAVADHDVALWGRAYDGRVIRGSGFSLSWPDGLRSARPGRTVARTGDLDGDGVPDLLHQEELPEGSFLAVYWPGAAPTADFVDDVASIEAIGAWDVDGDGYGDLAYTVAVGSGTDLVVLRGGLRVGLAARTWLRRAVGGGAIERGDFDADGLGDVAFVAEDGGLETCHRGAAPDEVACAWVAPGPIDDLRSVGDVIGDPAGDLVVVRGDDLVILPGRVGLGLGEAIPLPWRTADRLRVHALTGAGDLDADGWGEIALTVETTDHATTGYALLLVHGGEREVRIADPVPTGIAGRHAATGTRLFLRDSERRPELVLAEPGIAGRSLLHTYEIAPDGTLGVTTEALGGRACGPCDFEVDVME